MTAVVVGIGQDLAGDDGVGRAIARAVAARGLVVHEASDASLVVTLAGTARRIVIADAIVGAGPPGTVARIDPTALASGPAPVSSHGLGVAEALALASALHGEAALSRVAIVGVAIAAPRAPHRGLSAAVVAAIEPAARLVEALARADARPARRRSRDPLPDR